MSMIELLPLVERNAAGRLIAHGCVSRELAHGIHAMPKEDLRLPHPTVILVCVVTSPDPKIITHLRASGRDTGNDLRDTNGGHVVYHPACIGSVEAMERLIDQTALREAREELLLTRAGKPLMLSSESLIRFTDYGELILNDRSSPNFEYSTGYVVRIDPEVQFLVVDARRDGSVVELCSRLDSLEELEQEFRAHPLSFADGLSRVLRVLSDHSGSAYRRFVNLIV